MIQRKCCDACGVTFLEDGIQVILPEVYEGKEYIQCYECGWVNTDYTLEHPDECEDGQLSLNGERFAHLWIGRMFPKKGFTPPGKAYKVWRDAHPELGQKFDMSNFQEVPGIEKKIEELWGWDEKDTE